MPLVFNQYNIQCLTRLSSSFMVARLLYAYRGPLPAKQAPAERHLPSEGGKLQFGAHIIRRFIRDDTCFYDISSEV